MLFPSTFSGGSGSVSNRAIVGLGGGQSNFASQNQITQPSYRSWPSSTIQMYWNDYAGSAGLQAMNPPTNTRHPDYNTGGAEHAQYGNQVGITSLIRTMHDIQTSVGDTVFCLQNTKGANSVPNWLVGGDRWNEFIVDLPAAKTAIEALSLTWFAPFYVWIQGETDAANATLAAEYQANEAQFFTNLLARPEIPSTIKIYSVLIHPDMASNYPHLATVNTAKQANATTFSSNVEIVDPSTIAGLNVVNGHYDYNSEDLIGQHITSLVLPLLSA